MLHQDRAEAQKFIFMTPQTFTSKANEVDSSRSEFWKWETRIGKKSSANTHALHQQWHNNNSASSERRV
jgi:hypothetical protein